MTRAICSGCERRRRFNFISVLPSHHTLMKLQNGHLLRTTYILHLKLAKSNYSLISYAAVAGPPHDEPTVCESRGISFKNIWGGLNTAVDVYLRKCGVEMWREAFFHRI